ELPLKRFALCARGSANHPLESLRAGNQSARYFSLASLLVLLAVRAAASRGGPRSRSLPCRRSDDRREIIVLPIDLGRGLDCRLLDRPQLCTDRIPPLSGPPFEVVRPAFYRLEQARNLNDPKETPQNRDTGPKLHQLPSYPRRLPDKPRQPLRDRSGGGFNRRPDRQNLSSDNRAAGINEPYEVSEPFADPDNRGDQRLKERGKRSS